ncbi:MAG TPA: YkgJ family cysteine cluster protein [Opitutaceae bacterium]
MEDPAPGLDCQSCGACCFSSLDAYVRVSGDDWTRLGAEAERVAHFIGHRAYLRMTGGHCAALVVTPAPDGRGRFACSIYEQRPQVCRDLTRGSPSCDAEQMIKAAWAAGGSRPTPASPSRATPRELATGACG